MTLVKYDIPPLDTRGKIQSQQESRGHHGLLIFPSVTLGFPWDFAVDLL